MAIVIDLVCYWVNRFNLFVLKINVTDSYTFAVDLYYNFCWALRRFNFNMASFRSPANTAHNNGHSCL